jgi:hypothetical protein
MAIPFGVALPQHRSAGVKSFSTAASRDQRKPVLARITNRIQGRFQRAATATGLARPANTQLIPYGLLSSFRDIDQ